MNNLALRVENLGKRYRLQNKEFWAIRNVSFELWQGDVLGLIGHNGSGKSTLLKMLARITEPTEGRAGIKGRLAALLEVGTGFNTELTGRENIYLNASLLGMKRRDIKRKIDEIIDFAEISEFIDAPVKHYSSGMYIRLAFSVAAHLDPDVLLIDEVLGVGDVAFQKKCRAKILSMKDEGRTMVIVSHDTGSIRQLCTSTIWFDHGRVAGMGAADQVVADYNQAMLPTAPGALLDFAGRPGSGAVRITDYWLEVDGQRADVLTTGKDACIVLQYLAVGDRPTEGLRLSVQIQNFWDANMLWLQNDMMGHQFGPISDSGKLRCLIPRFPLTAGTYKLRVQLALNSGSTLVDEVNPLADLHVVEGDFYGTGHARQRETGQYFTDARWTLDTDLAHSNGCVRNGST